MANFDLSMFICRDNETITNPSTSIELVNEKGIVENSAPSLKFSKSIVTAGEKRKRNVHMSDEYSSVNYLGELLNSPNRLEQPLRLIIVGHNPSQTSWNKGHYYANPSNRMWPILRKFGFVDDNTTCEEDFTCPYKFGIGFTDLGLEFAETNSLSISKQFLEKWRINLLDRLNNHVIRCSEVLNIGTDKCFPKIIAFAGIRQWKALFMKAPSKVNYGIQNDRPACWPKHLTKSIVFVVPSTSGAAAMATDDRERPYADLYQLFSTFSWEEKSSSCNCNELNVIDLTTEQENDSNF